MAKDERITQDMFDSVLEEVTYSREVWTSHPELVKDPKDKDPETNRPKGAVKQNVTVDFTGSKLSDVLKRAADSIIIKYQNGYARKAPPSGFLLDDNGDPVESITINVEQFFKGRVSASPLEQLDKAAEKANGEQLKAMQDRIAEEIAKRSKK